MLIVKKFGGTSVGNRDRIFNVAGRCVEEYKKGNDVVVVLSAMGKYTDVLIDMAKEINPNPPKREMDMLLTTGEQQSVALMAMAMASMGVPAVSLNAFQVAMHTTSTYSNARLKRIDTERIRNELEQHKIPEQHLPAVPLHGAVRIIGDRCVRDAANGTHIVRNLYGGSVQLF